MLISNSQYGRLVHTPCQSFNVLAPSYSEITKTIKRMKSSSSACPFDQISVLTLKNCPILRTALHRIIEHCWKTKSVPRIWKHSFTILIVTVHGKTYVNDLGKCSLKSFVDRSLIVWNFYPFAKTF